MTALQHYHARRKDGYTHENAYMSVLMTFCRTGRDMRRRLRRWRKMRRNRA